jgi:hypothetical protein
MNRVGLSRRAQLSRAVPGGGGLTTFRRALESAEAAEAMKHDGVRPETVVMLVES